MSDFADAKRCVREFYAAVDGAGDADMANAFRKHTTETYRLRGVHPFNEINSRAEVVDTLWRPLREAVISLQRRQDIFMAGDSVAHAGVWVASMGHYAGLFDQPWLGIAPTGRMVFLRYAEFHRLEDGLIAESGIFFDLIGFMKQAGLSPLPVQTGAEIVVPGPLTHDGIRADEADPAETERTLSLVHRMTDDLVGSYGTVVHPDLLRRTWHEDMIWYGPSGIGTTYTIPRYQQQHQYPFREGLADLTFNGHVCRIAEGPYAAWFGWPNLSMRPKGGLMGLPGSNQRVDMRVVDIYRRCGDKLAENWVLIDIPYWLLQQGIDVLDRSTRLQ